jgi:hypothetical protein
MYKAVYSLQSRMVSPNSGWGGSNRFFKKSSPPQRSENDEQTKRPGR